MYYRHRRCRQCHLLPNAERMALHHHQNRLHHLHGRQLPGCLGPQLYLRQLARRLSPGSSGVTTNHVVRAVRVRTVPQRAVGQKAPRHQNRFRCRCRWLWEHLLDVLGYPIVRSSCTTGYRIVRRENGFLSSTTSTMLVSFSMPTLTSAPAWQPR
jgi:hypothetical protein